MTKRAFELQAELRHEQGKGASRRLRRMQDKIPAIIYGGGQPPVAIMLDHKKMLHALEHEAFYSQLLVIHIDNKPQQVILKDLQRHHFKKALLHADFLRVSDTDKINMHIPLHFIGEANCKAVKSGAIVSHRMIEVEVRCLASKIPSFIEVDVSQMTLNQTLHLSDLKLPAGVELNALLHGHAEEHNHAVVSIHAPHVSKDAEEADTNSDAAEVETAPKGKAVAAKSADNTKTSKEQPKGK